MPIRRRTRARSTRSISLHSTPMFSKSTANKDYDGDGVKNSKDCKPFNKKKQGFIHDIHKKILEKQVAHDQKVTTRRETHLKEAAEIEQLRETRDDARKVNITPETKRLIVAADKRRADNRQRRAETFKRFKQNSSDAISFLSKISKSAPVKRKHKTKSTKRKRHKRPSKFY